MPNIKLPAFKMPAMKSPDMKMAAPKISRRTRHRAALAATILLAAGFGAAAGAIATRSSAPPPPKPDTALIEENHALQRSVAKLNRDLTTLKANVESVARDSKAQIAKATNSLSDRLDKAMDVTGSIGKQAAVASPAPVATAAPAINPAPLPQPRPAIVQGWTVRDAQNGAAWLEYRGDLYRAVPGIPLPGLGHVEAIRREGNQWVVVTSKGIITSEQTSAAVQRERPYYPPYYRRY
jgi:hypothetical protein